PDWLAARAFAHRGLHGPDRPENSRAAFAAANAGGFGIELDVQASLGGSAFVFHDDELDRLAEGHGPIADLRPDELAAITLKRSDETIPALSDVLALIAGRAPVLIEIKSGRDASGALCRSVRAALDEYRGPAAIMSFHPAAVRWFARRAPHIIRGLVISEEGKKRRLTRSLALRYARPDFLAYDIRSLPSSFAARQRARGLTVVSWTVRTPREAETAALHADQIIHEMAAQ
ncbi:MAG: glycerophosphoryl diester phosphodiesterase, partial [Alphaproteobacteria bacterium]|nr:glycerophosphoryl diester phosphodiesterase [Alphaproteobacteria bacterium]